ncbi:MAG: 50S ribosomal protein L18Ae [Thermoprotei archaeon]|nr:50S ribosomal protein L18Ae [TACK group archaeon]
MSSEQQPRIYEVKGKVADGFYGHVFVKYVVATNEKRATDRVMSEVGSKHHVKRGEIRIESIKEVKDPDKIDDPIIKQMMQLERRKRRVSKPKRSVRVSGIRA